ncbi:hypothetical protein QVD99_001865 [Batrachochytrium dendrobatidis]|nr:hypothetical protein O5D80_000509 [Batrachochytrium dendrobatidis]KAK5672048.1 hypothetical protein QVD99_001865 [Batrachochytrium dendrobatidis]
MAPSMLSVNTSMNTTSNHSTTARSGNYSQRYAPIHHSPASSASPSAYRMPVAAASPTEIVQHYSSNQSTHIHSDDEHAAALAITRMAAGPHTAAQTQSDARHISSNAAKLRAANIALSKTVLTPNLLSPYLPAFIATLTYSMWHGRSFAEMAARPTPGLRLFARFTLDILRSTGLSFSVVLLALKYVHRIKSCRPDLQGAEGSECRLLVCTLMLAMKYLMDNTYSNKTWHKVSHIPLLEINVTEMEFLAQLNFDLHVQEEDYFGWLAFIEQAVVEFRHTTGSMQKSSVQQQVNTNQHIQKTHAGNYSTRQQQHVSEPQNMYPSTEKSIAHTKNPSAYPTSSRSQKHTSAVIPAALSFPVSTQQLAHSMPYPSPDASPIHKACDQREHRQQIEQQLHHLRQQLRQQTTPLSS